VLGTENKLLSYYNNKNIKNRSLKFPTPPKKTAYNIYLGSKHLTVQPKAAAIASSNIKSKLMLQTAKQPDTAHHAKRRKNA